MIRFAVGTRARQEWKAHITCSSGTSVSETSKATWSSGPSDCSSSTVSAALAVVRTSYSWA